MNDEQRAIFSDRQAVLLYITAHADHSDRISARLVVLRALLNEVWPSTAWGLEIASEIARLEGYMGAPPAERNHRDILKSIMGFLTNGGTGTG